MFTCPRCDGKTTSPAVLCRTCKKEMDEHLLREVEAANEKYHQDDLHEYETQRREPRSDVLVR